MADLLSLVKETGAYKILSGDKLGKRLSHAYLIINPDAKFSAEYLKIFLKTLACKSSDPCGECRICKLIDGGNFADAAFYPVKGETVVVDDVADLIEKSYIKPLETDKRFFVIDRGETMSAAVQNKLLKTLEEPPANVHIVIGATTAYPLLPTLLSRVRKLEIPAFTQEKLFSALSGECSDGERLRVAVAAGDGTVGKALSLYGDENLSALTDLVADMLVNMKSSRDVLEYSVKIASLKTDMSMVLSVLELLLRDMLCAAENRENLVRNAGKMQKLIRAQGFSEGALVYALEKTGEAQKRRKFNANAAMLTEWLLFQILEGKYKWQKL